MSAPSIDLFTWATPNGWKASCTLEELQMPYTLHPVDIMKGKQREREYVRLNPNSKIPTIVDREAGDFAVFESGAIMIYLAEKAGRLLPTEFKARSRVIQWLMFQMGGVGPMQGQANVFFRYFPERLPGAIARYQNEVKRLYGVLDRHLTDDQWLAGEFSIADIANWCWCRIHNWAGVAVDDLPNLQRWTSSNAPAAPGAFESRTKPTTTNRTRTAPVPSLRACNQFWSVRWRAMAKAIHSMIRVLDLARSIDFYERALGLKVCEQFEFDDFTLAYLRNEENEFEVELTLNQGRTEPYRHGDGYGHLAVCVNDCRAERERLASVGLQPGEVKEFYRDGALMARFFFIQDPDGYKVEVLERHGRYR